MSKDLLKDWTTQAYSLLDSIYDPERVKKLDSAILDLSKIGITGLVLYKIEADGITVKYNNRGSKSFQKVII